MATIQEFILRFKVEGGNTVKALKDDIRDLANQANPLSSSLGNLAGRMGPLAAGASAAAGAFALLGMKAIDLGDQLDDLANATGISSGQLMNLRSSLVQAGGDADSFSKFASKLSVAVGESASGNEKFQKSFKQLGVSITDANGTIRDTGDILEDVLAGLANTDPALRQAKAVEILGKEAAKIDWSNVRAGRDIEFDQAAKNLAMLRGEIDKLQISIEQGLLKAFGSLAKGYNEYGIDNVFARMTEGAAGALEKIPLLGAAFEFLNKKARESRQEAEAAITKQMEEAAAETKRLLGRAPAPQRQVTKVPGGGQGATPEATLKAIADSKSRIEQSQLEAKKQAELSAANEIQKIEVAAKYDALKAATEIKNKERLSDLQKAQEIAAKEAEIFAKRDADIAKARSALNAKIYSEEESQREANRQAIAQQEDAYAKGAKTALERADAYARSVEELQAQVDLEDRLRGMNDIQADTQRKIAEEIKRRTDAIRELENVENLAYEERLKREAQITADSEKAIEIIKKRGEAEYERSRSFSEGWGEAYRKYAEGAFNASDQAKTYFSTFTQGFEDAIVRFVQTGKLSFKDLANSMIAEFARIQAKRIATSLFGGTPGGGIFGGGGLFGGKIIPGFLAEGGPAMANQPYIVGERGPELFVPRMSGAVIPNDQLASSGIGGTQITYNIQAVDAASFKALVSRDPQFLFQVSERGRRSQPTRSR